MGKNLKSTFRLPGLILRPDDRLFLLTILSWNWTEASSVWIRIRSDSLLEIGAKTRKAGPCGQCLCVSKNIYKYLI
jgi:hypothetical protein